MLLHTAGAAGVDGRQEGVDASGTNTRLLVSRVEAITSPDWEDTSIPAISRCGTGHEAT